MLKISLPDDEVRFEAQALHILEDRGAVRLLQASEDGFCLLLERCLPGTDLWSVGAAERDAVACRMLRRMCREPGPSAPFFSLSETVTAWWDRLSKLPSASAYHADTVARAVARAQELTSSQPQQVLLHGDFHPGNVLAAQREPWLFIDPKPLVGEPAFDLAQWLYNRNRFLAPDDDPVVVLRQQVDRFATTLDLSPARIAGWAFVKALGWLCIPEVVTLFDKVAQAW